MGIVCVIAGLFFLLNPNIILLDVLPDCIGYLLILIGIYRASRLNLTLRDAFGDFGKLLILTLCKLPALWIYFSFAGGTGDVWGLLFAFGFGAFEAFFAIRAFKGLFDGLAALANAQPGADIPESAVFRRLDEVRLLTYLFSVIKPMLAALPELSNLSSEEFGTVTSDGIQSLSRFRLLFTVAAAAIVLILGIAWFVRIAGYFRRIGADRDFLEMLNRRYESEVQSDPLRLSVARISTALTLLTVGAVFCLEFKFDGFNLLPHPLCLGIFLGAVLWLRRIYPEPCRKASRTLIAAIIGTAVTWAYSFAYIWSFYSLYLTDTSEGADFSVSSVLETLMLRDFNVIYGYYGLIAAALIDGALFLWALLSLRGLLTAIIRDHTGGTVAPDGHLIGGGSMERNIRPTLFLLNAVIIAGAVSGLSGAAQAALLPYLPAYWMIDMAIRLVFIVLLIALTGKIRSEMKDRYDLG